MMMLTAFDYHCLETFHYGLFTGYYLIVALAIYVFYHSSDNTRGTLPLALVSLSSALAHILGYIKIEGFPDSLTFHVGLAAYCTWASPTIMLCIKEAITPGWLSWGKWFRYISPFMLGTLLCAITANIYILYVLVGLAIFSTVYCTIILQKSIDIREKLVKEYFTDIDSFGHGWVKVFMYYQILTSICLLLLFMFGKPYQVIIWNYIQAAFWLYFLLKCKEQRYYSTQIPEDIKKDFDQIEETSTKGQKEESEPRNGSDSDQDGDKGLNNDKTVISQETLEYLEKRLSELEEEKTYLDDTLNLTSLAQIVGTNRTYMSVYFRTKNTTFWDYINNKRCEYAIELMKQRPNITMAELSHLCGYKTENCFRSSFSTLYGKTPFAYKREIRAK